MSPSITPKEIRCIIWDCDGCLIDSELLACRVSAGLLTELGYPIEAQDYVDRFAGQGVRQALATIERETGLSFIERYPFERQQVERNALFQAELKAIEGVHEILERIDLPMCVASGSEPERLKVSLEIAGLYEKFAGRIFSASQVAHGKPAPDVFLFAAREMDVDPAHCLVIEDSVYGVQAARAAGMAVFAFTGASHASVAGIKKLQAEKTDFLFNDMEKLPALIAACQED